MRTSTVYGRRVRQARVIRKVPISAVRTLLGMTPKQWTLLEGAESSVMDAADVQMLAGFLRFPVQFFSTEPGSPVHRGSLLPRAKKSISMAELEQMATFAEMTCELLDQLAKTATRPPLRLPRIAERFTPEEAAQLVRESFDLDPVEPVKHLTHAVERAGIPVVVADIGSTDARHDAFSVWAGSFSDRPVLVCRPVQSWERIRWSIAHEIGHLAMHHTPRDSDIEAEANRFANEFLLPARMLRQEWPSTVTLSTLMPLKRRWRVSLSSLIMHAHNNGLIDADKKVGLFKQLSARRDPDTGVTWRAQEPGWDEYTAERPRLVTVMAQRGLPAGATAAGLSAASGFWAEDLTGAILAEQRANGVTVGKAPGPANTDLPGNVIPFQSVR